MANAHDLLMAQRAAMIGGNALPYLRRVAYIFNQNGQYINAPFDLSVFGDIARVELRFRVLQITTDQRLFQFCDTSRNRGLYFGNGWRGSFIVYGCSFCSPYKDDFIRYQNSVGNYEVVASNSNITFNGNPKYDTQEGFANIPQNNCKRFELFRNSNGGASTGFGFSSCDLYDNSGKVVGLIPVISLENEPCLYDEMSGQFFRNSGTGTFGFVEINAT